MYYLGIDPGKSGAYVLLDEAGEVCLVSPYQNWKAIHDSLIDITPFNNIVAVLEQVSAMKGQGVTSMFNFGGNYEGWQALMEVLDIRYTLIGPQRWQKAIVGSIPKGKSKEYTTNYVKRKYGMAIMLKTARSKVPDTGIADAICMAEYARIQHLNPTSK